MANREFNLDKYSKSEIRALPTADELRAALAGGESAEVRTQLSAIFDDSTFIELAAYTKRAFSEFVTSDKANELEGVICGYGAIGGKLVFAFAEDVSRMGGVIDDRHAKKILDLYEMAVKNGAPVIGIFNSKGTDIFAGTSALAAYSRIMKAAANASGLIPQIAYVAGKCIGTAAAIASMFDFVVKEEKAEFYVSSPNLTGVSDAQNESVAYVGTASACADYIRSMIAYLPENAAEEPEVGACADNLNRMIGDLDFSGDALSMIATIVDSGIYLETAHDAAQEVATVLTTIGGVKCGIVATSFAKNEGRLTAQGARKIAKFVNFCDAYSIAVVTLVDSYGLSVDVENERGFAKALSDLAFAYATSDTPKVTVICGHAVGSAFALLAPKALGADVVYALDRSEIGALNAESGVAFAWDKYITEENDRDALVNEWKANVSSPVAAAASGEIDDIISVNELRARICSALLMLSAKGKYRKVFPL